MDGNGAPVGEDGAEVDYQRVATLKRKSDGSDMRNGMKMQLFLVQVDGDGKDSEEAVWKWKSRDRLAWGDAAKDEEIAKGDVGALWEREAERWLNAHEQYRAKDGDADAGSVGSSSPAKEHVEANANGETRTSSAGASA